MAFKHLFQLLLLFGQSLRQSLGQVIGHAFGQAGKAAADLGICGAQRLQQTRRVLTQALFDVLLESVDGAPGQCERNQDLHQNGAAQCQKYRS